MCSNIKKAHLRKKKVFLMKMMIKVLALIMMKKLRKSNHSKHKRKNKNSKERIAQTLRN